MTSLVQLVARFQRLSKLDVSRSLAPVHEVMLTYAREQFRTSGRAGGQPWADYSGEPKYKAYKAAIGADPRPLRWRPGSMERLMPSLTDPRDPAHLWRVAGDAVTFGSSLPYAARIERGGTNQFGERSPPRSILPDSPGLRRAVTLAVQRDLRQRITRDIGLTIQTR